MPINELSVPYAASLQVASWTTEQNGHDLKKQLTAVGVVLSTEISWIHTYNIFRISYLFVGTNFINSSVNIWENCKSKTVRVYKADKFYLILIYYHYSIFLLAIFFVINVKNNLMRHKTESTVFQKQEWNDPWNLTASYCVACSPVRS